MQLPFLIKKSSRILGLDVSASSAKLLELSRNDRGYQVESFAVLPTPSGLVVEKSFKILDEVGSLVKDLLNKAKTSLRGAAIAVPDSSIITKTIQLDAELSESDIENQVAAEAERYIPYPLEEVNLDFTVLGPSKKGHNQVDVLLVASRSENVNARVQALAIGGVKAQIVDVESYAVERACELLKAQLPKQGKEQTIAVVDIGATMTNLIVMDNFKTIYTRDELFGGQQMTAEIQEYYGVSYSEAGKLKKMGDRPEDFVKTVLEPFQESVVLQLRRALQFFYSATDYTEINHLLLAGGGAKVEGLAKRISEQLAIPTTVANPFVDMTVSEKVDRAALMKDAPSLLSCCGLAMRSFT